MNNRTYTLVAVVVIILLVVAGLTLFNKQAGQVTTNPTPLADDMASPMMADKMASISASPSSATSQATASATPRVKQFAVVGSNLKFTPAQLTVNKGDTVRVTFSSTSGTHDFGIDELNVRTKVLPAGQQEVVEFVADKAGTFEFYCAVGNHRALGMVGKLVVQ